VSRIVGEAVPGRDGSRNAGGNCAGSGDKQGTASGGRVANQFPRLHRRSSLATARGRAPATLPLAAGAAPHARSDGEVVSPIPTPKASLTRQDGAMAPDTAPMLLWDDMRCFTRPGDGSLNGKEGILPDGSGLESIADPDASEVVGEGFGTDAQGFVATVAGGIADDG